MSPDMLFVIGIVVTIAAAVLGVASWIVLLVSGKKLNKQLDLEYGEKKH